MELAFTAVFKKVSEGYIAFVETPGANTQGETLEEASPNQIFVRRSSWCSMPTALCP